MIPGDEVAVTITNTTAPFDNTTCFFKFVAEALKITLPNSALNFFYSAAASWIKTFLSQCKWSEWNFSARVRLEREIATLCVAYCTYICFIVGIGWYVMAWFGSYSILVVLQKFVRVVMSSVMFGRDDMLCGKLWHGLLCVRFDEEVAPSAACSTFSSTLTNVMTA